jgi:hypothetical protein
MAASGEFDTSPVRAFLPGPGLRDGLELPAGLTVLVTPRGFFRHLFEA